MSKSDNGEGRQRGLAEGVKVVRAADKKPSRTPPRLTNEEKIAILTLSSKGASIGDIARAVTRSESTVSRYLARMIDSTVLAKATLRAGAVNLAERIIAKADVKESIEVLTRPDIGVLQPAVKSGDGSGGWQLSVGINSCGTVVRLEQGNGAKGQLGQPEGNVIEARATEATTLPGNQAGANTGGVPALPRGEGPA